MGGLTRHPLQTVGLEAGSFEFARNLSARFLWTAYEKVRLKPKMKLTARACIALLVTVRISLESFAHLSGPWSRKFLGTSGSKRPSVAY